MSENPNESTAAIDFQFSWEGLAEHAPGVLFDLPKPMTPISPQRGGGVGVGA